MLKEKIKLPGGLVHDQKIRVPHLGHASDVYTSFAGDLLLTIKVKEHSFFKRVPSKSKEFGGTAADQLNKDIETEVPLTLIEALQGSRITVHTVDGPLNIVTRPGICTGDTMRLKHFGAPEFNPPDGYDPETLRGDHIIKFKVILPNYDPTSTNEKDLLLKQLLDLDEQNKDKYYGHYEAADKEAKQKAAS